MERWEYIKPNLPSGGVVLDIGAAEGYFGNRIAEETNLLAVSIEKNAGRATFQKAWLNGLEGKVISCCFTLNKDFTSRLVTTCEFVDAILLLSTLHWINSDGVLRDLSLLAGKLFIEIPSLDDYKATGQNFIDKVRAVGDEKTYFENITGRRVTHIAEVKAHTSPTRNLWLIDGPFKREPSRPHINYTNSCRAYYLLEYDNDIRFTKHRQVQDWVHGINLATLGQMGVIFPEFEWWESKVRESIPKNVKGDLRIHNLIVSRDKLTWIDTDHHAHPPTIMEDIECLR